LIPQCQQGFEKFGQKKEVENDLLSCLAPQLDRIAIRLEHLNMDTLFFIYQRFVIFFNLT